jgi:predicted LPLAT superfamily acyltransferase
MSKPIAAVDWKQRPEGGGRFALRLFRGIACVGGRRLGRLCLYPITAYFTLVRGPERRASIDYLTRVLGRPARLLDGARHVHTFAATILDRVFLLGGRIDDFDVEVRGLPELHAVLDQGRGVLLFGSHLGSFEVLRVLARKRPDYVIRVVLDKSQSPAMTQLLDELNPEIAAGVIDASQDGPSIVMAIHDACAQGAMVALLVDRVRGDEPSLPAPFLGDAAHFPTAPWLIAAALKVPVVLGFGLYRGGNRYELVFEPFADAVEVPRGRRAEALSALIRRYAARLETFARSAPYNWFNFYDVWKTRPGGDAQAPDAAPAVDDAAVQRRTALRRGGAAG